MSQTIEAQRPRPDNADVLALHYSGTPALKTDFTRLGRRTLWGALADARYSARRYVLNNFQDGWRQDAFDLFLGNYRPSDSKLEPEGGGGGGGGMQSGGGSSARGMFTDLSYNPRGGRGGIITALPWQLLVFLGFIVLSLCMALRTLVRTL